MSPRTVTKILSLKIVGHEGYAFSNHRVSVQTASGHIKDSAPELAFSNEAGMESLYWQQLSPKPGEVYQTYWSDENFGRVVPIRTNLRKNKVVQISDYLRLTNH